MKIFGIALIILWLVAGAVTLMSDNKRTLKTNYFIAWIILIMYMIMYYFVD